MGRLHKNPRAVPPSFFCRFYVYLIHYEFSTCITVDYIEAAVDDRSLFSKRDLEPTTTRCVSPGGGKKKCCDRCFALCGAADYTVADRWPDLSSIDVSVVMRHAMMKPAGTNVVGWSPHQLFLLLLLAWMIVVDSSSVSSSSSSSSNNNNMPGRVVKTKYGNLRGITLPGGSAQPTTTTTPSPGKFFSFSPTLTF